MILSTSVRQVLIMLWAQDDLSQILMPKKVKTVHVLNWFHGNICTKKCPMKIEREHYQTIKHLIKGHEDYLITHKLFIKAMREKHKICDLPEKEFQKSTKNFWKHLCKNSCK